MKRAAIILILPMLLLSGCSASSLYAHHYETNETILISTLGIDKTANGVLVTATTGIGIDGGERIFRHEDESVAGAINALSKNSVGRNIEFSHNENIILGESAAELMPEILDYVSRVPELRLAAKVFIAADSTAEDVINKTSGEKEDVSDMLKMLSSELEATGYPAAETCLDVYSDHLGGEASAVTAIGLRSNEDKTENASKSMLVPEGVAVIKGGEFICRLTGDSVRGLAFLRNEVYEQTVTLPVAGLKVTAKLTKARAVVSAGEDGSVRIDEKCVSELCEVSGDTRLSGEELKKEIERALALDVLRAIESVSCSEKNMGEDIARLAIRLPRRAEISPAEAPWTVSVSQKLVGDEIPVDKIGESNG